MTLDEAFHEIYDGILDSWPDRKGGGLTIAETAQLLQQKFGGSGSYEVVRRSLAAMDVPVKKIGLGKRIMIRDLAMSLARMVSDEPATPAVARRSSRGFRDNKLDIARKSPRGAVTPSTVGFATHLPPDGPWPLRPLEEEPVLEMRTDFASDLAKVRYMRRIERMEIFWKEVLVELNHLEADDRDARARAITLPPRKKPIHSS